VLLFCSYVAVRWVYEREYVGLYMVYECEYVAVLSISIQYLTCTTPHERHYVSCSHMYRCVELHTYVDLCTYADAHQVYRTVVLGKTHER